MFSDAVRKFNMLQVRVYGANDEKIKVALLRSVRSKGLEAPFTNLPFVENRTARAVPLPSFLSPSRVYELTEETINGAGETGEKSFLSSAEKLYNNILRAKRTIFELAFCNQWDYFFTGTIAPEKFNRADLRAFYKAFAKYIANLRRRGIVVRYLFVPELHSDGKSWHLHGFIAGLPLSALHQFVIGDRMGKHIAERVKAGEAVFSWSAYAEKFGFCDLEPIKNREAVSKYITKYINKALFENKSRFGCHLFYCSKGLKRSRVVARGLFIGDAVKWQYQNAYCSVLWLDNTPANMEYCRSLLARVDYEETRENHLITKVQKKFKARILRACRSARGAVSLDVNAPLPFTSYYWRSCRC